MNPKPEQADEYTDNKIQMRGEYHPDWHSIRDTKFAELIVQECVNQCRQEWYDLNNAAPKENETSRDISIRVGQKNGVLKTISRIKEHFGIGEQTVPNVSADDRALFSGIGSSESFTVEGAKKAFGVED